MINAIFVDIDIAGSECIEGIGFLAIALREVNAIVYTFRSEREILQTDRDERFWVNLGCGPIEEHGVSGTNR